MVSSILLVAVSITITVAQNETLNTENGTGSKPVEKFISEEERREYVQRIQDETTLTMVPAMVLLLLVAVIGIIGNSLVLYVYSQEFNINGTRVLILVVAAFDLVSNVIVIPAEVYDMFHDWDFDHPWVCRIRWYINAFVTSVSAELLTALAVVRYRKVCVPYGWQISARQAKKIALIIVICSALFAVPYGVINGTRTRPTPRPEIYGYECNIDDSFADSIWPLINNGFFILLVLGNSSTIVILYSLVGTKALRHGRAVRKGTSSGGPANSDGAATSMTSAGNSKSEEDRNMSGEENTSFVKISTSQRTVTFTEKRESTERSTVSEGDEDTRSAENSRVEQDKNTLSYVTDDENADKPGNTLTPARKNREQDGVVPKRSLNRTTVMLIIISAVYIIGFLPYVTLTFYFDANRDEKEALDFVGRSLYNLFLRFILLNCASNPVIYGICDLTFRKKCVSAVLNTLRFCRSSQGAQ